MNAETFSLTRVALLTPFRQARTTEAMVKRKLDDNGVPQETKASDSSSKGSSFESLGLTSQLLQAIAKEKWATPTPIQARAIPLAMEGRDVLARAKTGSGKTAAYVLPILQSILKRKSQASKTTGTTALILVPTRELASQVQRVILSFSKFCSKDVRVVDLTSQISDQAQTALLSSSPGIVVATPARASAHLNGSTLIVKDLAHLVIDEADLVLSYEYGEDFDNIVKLIPQGVQTFLASATLTPDVETLKGLFCRDPVIVDFNEEEKESASVNQYAVKCGEDEKFLLLFAVFKLKLIKGKCIIFVADVDRCYRIKLYLEQFGIKSCVLNSELPTNCRVHTVEEFNKSVYDIIIATDEQQMTTGNEADQPQEALTANGEAKSGAEKRSAKGERAEMDANDDREDATTEPPKKKSRNKSLKSAKSSKRSLSYGISRGIDFHLVSCVLNFDLPANARSYTHRIGRTARAGRTGIALSFSIPKAKYRKQKNLSHPCTINDEAVLDAIEADQGARGKKLEPYSFDMAKLEGFKYRVASALKAVGPGAVREARLREIRQEMLRSERLKRHLTENPADERWLRHDENLRPKIVQPHLKHVPEYLMPGANQGVVGRQDGEWVDAPFRKENENRIRKARDRNKLKGKGKRGAGGQKRDPLKTFNASGMGKK